MGKKITGNAGEAFSIKSNDETGYLLRADIRSYYFLGAYELQLLLKTQLNEKDWMYEKRNVLYTQCRGKRWV